MMYNGVYIILYIDSILMHTKYAIQQYDVIHIDTKDAAGNSQAFLWQLAFRQLLSRKLKIAYGVTGSGAG